MTTVQTDRTRTHFWDDPAVTAEAAHKMSGLEFLEAVSRGDLPSPPIMSTLGFEGFEVGPGWARFTLTPGEHHYNPIGSVHGGVMATLLDSALSCAVHSTLEPGSGYTTLDLQVTFVRPLTATTGTVQCDAKVIHVGGRVGTSEARITDADGRIYAHGTATCLVLR